MLQGYKTWLGLLITVIGVTGISKYVTGDQIAQVADAAEKIVGIALAIYGNFQVHKRLDAAQEN
jgi:hypothetical protein